MESFRHQVKYTVYRESVENDRLFFTLLKKIIDKHKGHVIIML